MSNPGFVGQPGKQQISPPMKGVFPLDHFQECHTAELNYLKCLKQSRGQSVKCTAEIRDYLRCRMDR